MRTVLSRALRLFALISLKIERENRTKTGPTAVTGRSALVPAALALGLRCGRAPATAEARALLATIHLSMRACDHVLNSSLRI